MHDNLRVVKSIALTEEEKLLNFITHKDCTIQQK